MHGFHLGVDYGTSNTVAVLRWPDGKTRPLLFDGSPILPSAVYLETDGRVLVGRDAERAARLDPARYEPNPKRHVDATDLLLGEASMPVRELIAATLRRVAAEVLRTIGNLPAVTLTHPATWGPRRRALLVEAAVLAGFPQPALVSEPVAAAAYFATVLRSTVRRSAVSTGAVVVYDLGGGTCDVSVVRWTGDGPQVLATGGLPDFGGVDLDGLAVEQIGALVAAGDPAAWARLTGPTTPEERRHFRALWDDARAAKEALSRQPAAGVHVPIVDRTLHLSREEYEHAAAARLAPSADVTRSVIEAAGLAPEQIAGLFLVGGSTRMPAVATVLHRATGIAPTVLEQPEIVVAEGALHAPGPVLPAAPAGPTSPPPGSPVPPAPVAGAWPPAPVPPAPMSPAPVPIAPRSHLPVPPAPVPEQPAARSSQRLAVLGGVGAAALVLALVMVVAIQALHRAGSHRGTPNAAGTTASAPTTTTPAPPVHARLPDTCALGPSLPRQVASVKPRSNNSATSTHSCSWDLLRTDQSAELSITMQLYTSGDDPVDRAHESYRTDLDDAADPESNGGYRRDPQPLSGLGDEAFAARLYDPVDAGPNERSVTRYEKSGALLEIRTRNAVLTVKWSGATYPAGVRGGKTLRGTDLPYDRARDEAIAIARQILAQL